MSSLEKTNYCPRCREKLIKEEYFVRYDSENGNEIKYTKVHCPNNKWYNNHLYAIFDEDGCWANYD
jgi:hypothetical protein